MTSTSSFPTSKDTIDRKSPTDTLSGHSDLHDRLADSIEHLQDKVGIDSDSTTSSHDYKITQLESTALTTATTFGGDVSGTYNNIVVGNDSHSHDTAYYTKAEVDGFVTQATDTVTGFFKGTRGNKTNCEVNATGHATIPHNLGTTPTAAFVTTQSQVTTGTGGGEYVIALPVTAMDGTNITFRAYEVNVENTNDNSSVSTIFTNNAGSILINVSWMALL